MKNFTAFIIIGLIFISAGNSQAQTGIWVDSSYGILGRTEINIGGFSNEVTGDIISHDSKIVTICGKIGTAANGIYRFGMARFDSTGKLDPNFGTAGIVNLSWNATEYPTNMVRYYDITDSSYILCGVSGTSSLATSLLPSLYRFRKNGIPDSLFGTNGRIVMPFDDKSSGEADHVFVSQVVDHFGYVICGTSRASETGGKTGFGVMQIDSNGHLDSNFGFGGRAIITAAVHSVQGFFLNDNNIFMCGISDTGKPEIIIARFIANYPKIGGIPDSSVGINGLIHTGIFLPIGDSIMAALESDDKIIILLPAPDSSPTPISLCRFNPLGYIDSSYGVSGIAKNYISPSIKPKGLIISSDLSSFVSGITNTGLGQSIFMRLNDTSAAPDPKYFRNGTAVFDLDNGTNPNYMKYLEPVGRYTSDGVYKRYAGVGGSIHDGIEYFMVARFITCPLQQGGVDENIQQQNNSLAIYPNPVIAGIHIQISDGLIKKIKIVDVLGREMLNLDENNFSYDTKTFSGSISNLPNGIYYCIAQGGAQQVMRKFIISH